MLILDQTEPKAVFSFFERLCTIPRGSTNMKAVHTPSERLSTVSTQRTWKFLRETQRQMRR